MLADTIGRVAISSATVPAGIVVACIGAPYFYIYYEKRLNGFGCSVVFALKGFTESKASLTDSNLMATYRISSDGSPTERNLREMERTPASTQGDG